ncbi:MAG: gamma-glutamyltransferase [Chloroflexi bacterium]|nr:gamma-glutamyltransferase [Chloroflexota bacterium]
MIRRYPSRRSVVMGYGGAVATSQPLASQAGLRTLLAGGNAIDAAIAANATLNVVEPMSNGLGGDLFALVYWAKERRVYGLNASGRAPGAASLEALQQRGHTAASGMPMRGMLPVTVPGEPAGWADLHARFGALGWPRVLAPAIAYAEQGYPVSEIIAGEWQAAEDLLRCEAEAARVYLPGGHAPRAGERFANPDLAASLRALAERGPEVFYRGDLARAIAAASERRGGLLALDDLVAHSSTWVEPVSTLYRGYRVYEIPPNGQGIAALIALNLLDGLDLSHYAFDAAECLHLKMEAVKLGMTDAARYVADPTMADVPVAGLLAAAYADERRALIRTDRAIARPEAGLPPSSPDTVYLCAADAEGNACSLISSLYMGFGSGVVPEGTGLALQNRGNLFSLDPTHPNCIAPHKRPYHTIIPCMVTRDDALAVCYGVMGGFMQPQGHVQVLSNLVDHGLDPQQALDAPRFYYQGEDRFLIERGLPSAAYAGLRARGHALERRAPGGLFGGGQVIMVDPASGALLAGSDPRKDGCAEVY